MRNLPHPYPSPAFAKLPRDAPLRAKTIVERLGGIWRGSRGECRCPAHDDRSPSLSVRLGTKAILYHCFAGCTAIEVMQALRRLDLHDRQTLRMPQGVPAHDMGTLALELWKASQPVAGTLAERYLRARGLQAPYPRALRFHANTILGSGPRRRMLPAMIAAVENDLGVVAIQRTFLDAEDPLRRPVVKPKRALGLLGAAAIRLAPSTDELGLAEGIEDALSAMAWFGTPTWALGGVERIAFVAIPETVRRVIVYGDRGCAASRLLAKARAHLVGNGRELITRVPSDHKDWNEAWRARGGCHRVE